MKRYARTYILLIVLSLSACTNIQIGDNDATESPPSSVLTPISTLHPMTEYDYGDGGLISGVPCGAPCFMGITPGDDIESVANSLENLGINAYCQWYTRKINCPGFHIELRPDEQTVWYIQFGTSDPNLEFGSSAIYLSDVIEKYGEPVLVDIFIVTDIDVLSPYHNLELCYDNPYMLIGLENQDSDHPYNATPSSRVQYVMYGEESVCRTNYGSQWHGYGEYQSP